MAKKAERHPFHGIVLFPGTEDEFTVDGKFPYTVFGRKYSFYSTTEGHFIEVDEDEVKRAKAVKDGEVERERVKALPEPAPVLEVITDSEGRPIPLPNLQDPTADDELPGVPVEDDALPH